MAIIINIDVMMAKRKMSMNELSRRTKIGLVNLSILKNGRAKAVKMVTINQLCKILNCQPGDLLAYTADPLPKEQEWELDNEK